MSEMPYFKLCPDDKVGFVEVKNFPVLLFFQLTNFVQHSIHRGVLFECACVGVWALTQCMGVGAEFE